MTKEKAYISVGIDPAGIGTTGIAIRTHNLNYPSYWNKQIKASNPVQAFELIIEFIKKVTNKYYLEDLSIKFVVVELLFEGKELFKEVKATRELIGMLRLYFRSKFCGHLPAHKDKELIKKLLKKHGKKNEHWIHAYAILLAHINSKKLRLKCENWRNGVKDYAS